VQGADVKRKKGVISNYKDNRFKDQLLNNLSGTYNVHNTDVFRFYHRFFWMPYKTG
jgi:hypothetical protein